MNAENETEITVRNATGFGYPEISYFYNDYFLKYVEPNNPDYENITFSHNLTARLLAYDRNLTNHLRNPDTLLHVGNLEIF